MKQSREQAVMALAHSEGDGFSRRWFHNGEEWLYDLSTLGCHGRARSYSFALSLLIDALREKGYTL